MVRKFYCDNLILVKILFLINNTILLFSGLFLFLQVIAPLHVRMVKLRHYTVIGWGKCLPLLSNIYEFSSVFLYIKSKYNVCSNQNKVFLFVISASCDSGDSMGHTKLPRIFFFE